MNNPLDLNFEGLNFSACNRIHDSNASDLLQDFEKSIEIEGLTSVDLWYCEICHKQFSTRKDLQKHILSHLKQPRLILKRITDIKSVKQKSSESYWSNSEKKGSLKLTLKKNNFYESLKLTLKKSPVSEDFTVVNRNLNLGIENKYTIDVAGAKENDHRDDQESENSVNQHFENVMVDQQDEYGNIKFNAEESNSLEDNERPSLDVNEGDSGVGSDMANPSEKEDQNVDDLQGSDHYDQPEKRLSESEDLSEALEETCRETIENLKKLGEQSSSMSTHELIEDESIEDEEGTRESNMIYNLEENPITLVSKSSTYPAHSSSESDDKREESEETPSDFNWNQLSTDLTTNNNEASKENEQQSESSTDGNIENAGSILHNFLIEHQRRNQSETSLSNNLPPVETEYVSLEKLAETVNTCRVCNEKFKDITQLDEHRSKAGHYQCSVPDCVNLVFNSPLEVSMHKTQVHGTPMSPSVSQLSPHLNTNSPHLNQNSPHLNQNSPHLSQASPHLNANSPHAVAIGSPNTSNAPQINRTSPLDSPHQTNSPTYNTVPSASQQLVPPVNFEQLSAPVQQLAQQVQRMPLPQAQMPPSLPPGANTMIPGANYFVQPPGRPPLYRVPSHQGMHYSPHLSHLYSQYGPPPYPGMTAPPQMHPQIPQQMPRGRYPSVVQNSRVQRMPQAAPVLRQRVKRSLQQMSVQQQNNSAIKQRRMDVLLPDRNEDADCHVIAQQKRNDGLPVIQNVQGATTQQTSRNDSTIHLTDSITLSVRQPAQIQNTLGPAKKSDAKAVANVLAARGITVTPASNKNRTGEQQSKQQQQQPAIQQHRSLMQQQSPVNVTALNLNSAISIIPAGSQRKQQEQSQFAMPQNKQNKPTMNEVERPPRPPTVDLTQDTPTLPVVRRGRPPRALLTCQVCDKNFQNQEMLTQHMATHRAPSKLHHKCNLCPAQYPTAQALATHKQTYHKEVDTLAQNGGIELAIPVVDLKSPTVLNRLSNLGIQSYIPLSQLSAQTGGYFGLPIITMDGARNSSTCNLGALGATSILSLGPLKHLLNR